MHPTYTLYEYAEAGHWREFFASHRLWECQYQAGRLEMPWRIEHDGKIVMRGDGLATVVSE